MKQRKIASGFESKRGHGDGKNPAVAVLQGCLTKELRLIKN